MAVIIAYVIRKDRHVMKSCAQVRITQITFFLFQFRALHLTYRAAGCGIQPVEQTMIYAACFGFGYVGTKFLQRVLKKNTK